MLRPVDAMVFTAPARKWAPTQELFVSHPSKSQEAINLPSAKSCFETTARSRLQQQAQTAWAHSLLRDKPTIDLLAECHTTITHMYIIISCDSSLASQDDGTSHVAGPRCPTKEQQIREMPMPCLFRSLPFIGPSEIQANNSQPFIRPRPLCHKAVPTIDAILSRFRSSQYGQTCESTMQCGGVIHGELTSASVNLPQSRKHS